MNDFMRYGRGDTYVEVSHDWALNDYDNIVWYFRDCMTVNGIVSKDLKEAIIEAFEITKGDLK